MLFSFTVEQGRPLKTEQSFDESNVYGLQSLRFEAKHLRSQFA